MAQGRKRALVRGTLVVAAALTCVAWARTAARDPAVTVTVIAYGDTRFTDVSNTSASNPAARRALVAQIAGERPDAILVSGDLPWHGGTLADYDEYRSETTAWRDRKLRVLPTLGNHEFSGCRDAACLENWWNVFPEIKGERWYAADIGPNVRTLSLDSLSPLTSGSPQRVWIERQFASLAPDVRFVLISLHHPPVADVQTRVYVDHNPRPNEIALAEYLEKTAALLKARIIVIAGHVHNYERLSRGEVTYLVSGGGGAAPYAIDRTPADLYQSKDFPNFHYVKMTIDAGTLIGEMFRLDDPAASPPHFTLRDTFTISAR
jgi:hypothetical protein